MLYSQKPKILFFIRFIILRVTLDQKVKTAPFKGGGGWCLHVVLLILVVVTRYCCDPLKKGLGYLVLEPATLTSAPGTSTAPEHYRL